MNFGRIRQDEDGHMYLVPEGNIKEFDRRYREMEKEEPESEQWYDAVDRFNTFASDFRSDGGLEQYKIVLPDELKPVRQNIDFRDLDGFNNNF